MKLAIDKRHILNQAHKLLDKGLYDRAIKEYQRIVDADASDVFALQKIAELHCRNGAYASAVQYYEMSYRVLNKKGFHEKCVGVLKRIIDLEPGRLDFHRDLARNQAELGRLEEAAETLKTLIGVYERKGERQESLRLLKELVGLRPSDWTNRIRLAEGYAALGKNILAVETFKKVLDTLSSNDNRVEFDRVAERTLYLYPDQTDVGVSLSRSYLVQGKLREALTWLQVLFKSNPKHPETLELLGDAFVTQERNDKALAVYKEARRVLKMAGRDNEAQRLQEKIFSADPDASLSMVSPRNPISITSQHPSSVDAELPIAMLLSDALILCEFELYDHALLRLESLPETFQATGPNLEKVLQLSTEYADTKHSALADKIEKLAKANGSTVVDPSVEVDEPAELEVAQAPTISPQTEATPARGMAINLEDEINLSELDFSEFEDESSVITESVLDRIDTRELNEDSFDFEVSLEEEVADAADDFADLLERDVSISTEQSDVITPPMVTSSVETQERFPRIRPLIDAKVKTGGDPDQTEEVTALIDDFTENEEKKVTHQTNPSKTAREGASTVAKKTTSVEKPDDDDFGGLLEPED